MEKLITRKKSITDRHIKRHDSTEKKLKPIIKQFQVTSTSEKCIVNPKKAAQSFKFMKTQGMSGSQEQKGKKTASTVTTNFFGQKNTTAQIHFCKDY